MMQAGSHIKGTEFTHAKMLESPITNTEMSTCQITRSEPETHLWKCISQARLGLREATGTGTVAGPFCANKP